MKKRFEEKSIVFQKKDIDFYHNKFYMIVIFFDTSLNLVGAKIIF